LADKLPLDVIEKIKNAYYNGEDVWQKPI
jgi:hypothetical protein